MAHLRTVEIIAHRGASRDRLENTLSAFRTALAQGADGIELDVHATRDRVVVVHHDPVVRRLAGSGGGSRGSLSLDRQGSRGSRGSLSLDRQDASSASSDNDPLGDDPLGDDPLGDDSLETRVEIAQVDYAELRTLTLANGESVPTLDEVLALAAGKATVYIEVKGATIEQDVLGCINRHPTTAIAVHSFDHRIPHAMGQLDARVPLGILSSSYVLDVEHMIRSANARDLWQHTVMVDQALIDVTHTAGARLVVWTENNFNHAIQLVQMGVDAICTDIPGEMRAALANAGLAKPHPVA